ncbi:ABC transporter, ATP-binding domain-containing protein [Cardiosporidium cionae]|uniref:ABC transporter, ATP-binding domain-containing protein n=1 Tax=Cardiosporidium cionae TaxID=476202 RepID=A0ABQ7JFF6_9APIC|nr:ABC transporter, ATP-binding domain-containing protein [Cardiosporidium cionae]|eukprot:KAF8822766.1 ABC transporter, ATP-binding domain-containing protein [Cardiosporidium cionae]
MKIICLARNSMGTDKSPAGSRKEGNVVTEDGIEQSALSSTLADTNHDEIAVKVSNLSYSYRVWVTKVSPNCLSNIDLEIVSGSRVLVVGLNGAGKSTLLSILGGRKLIPAESVHIFGRSAFHDLALQKNVLYLSDPWKHEYCYDISVKSLLKSHIGTERFNYLVDILDIDLSWSLSLISDGQRRRCQLLANLIEKKDVYILDEVTSDLDLLAREGLMRLLQTESEDRKATVMYATHIFDNMEEWPTHILYLRKGRVECFSELNSLQAYIDLKNRKVFSPLFELIRNWFFLEKKNQGKLSQLCNGNEQGALTV